MYTTYLVIIYISTKNMVKYINSPTYSWYIGTILISFTSGKRVGGVLAVFIGRLGCLGLILDLKELLRGIMIYHRGHSNDAKITNITE